MTMINEGKETEKLMINLDLKNFCLRIILSTKYTPCGFDLHTCIIFYIMALEFGGFSLGDFRQERRI